MLGNELDLLTNNIFIEFQEIYAYVQICFEKPRAYDLDPVGVKIIANAEAQGV